ncbi:MAG: SCP2 sterol-binding domain-containing protein [Thermoplasmata archaeon]
MSSKDILKQIAVKASAKPEILKDIAGNEKQYQINPADSSHYYVSVGKGALQVIDGDSAFPAATISATDALLSDLFQGKVDPVQSFMSGKLKVSGDIFGAQKLTDLMKKAGK